MLNACGISHILQYRKSQRDEFIPVHVRYSPQPHERKVCKVLAAVANAIRLMLGLQLNWEVPGSKRPFKEQECARRLVWQLFNFDRIFAEGFEAYICCREENMKIRLPCAEEAFNANREVVVEYLNDKPSKTNSR